MRLPAVRLNPAPGVRLIPAEAALLCLALASCSAASVMQPHAAGPAVGSLEIRLGSVPADAHPQVTISGPDGYLSSIATSTTIENLPPGRYRVSALTAATERGIAVPTEPTALLDVPEGGAADISFEYEFRGFADAATDAATPAATGTPSDGPDPGDLDPSAIPGSPGDYRFTAGSPSMPVRWNPCQPVSWRLTTDDGGEESRIQEAFAKASAATGIIFRQVGRDDPAQILVAIRFTPGSTVEGEGDMRYSFVNSGSIVGRKVAHKGTVDAVVGTDSAEALRTNLYLHEIGHALGLAHVGTPDEVMYSPLSFSSPLTEYSQGDREGLRRLGRQAGCLNSPRPLTNAVATGAKRLDRPPIPQIGGDPGLVLRADHSFTFGWTATLSDPPTLQTRVFRVDPARSDVHGLVPIPLPLDFRGDQPGRTELTALVAGGADCHLGDEYRIVQQNIFGATTTPVTINSCTVVARR